ncbi:MAG TPA: hypothetical protein PKD72_11585, partial [Gemmatales bacterium]|nr:hypothetical protein [Gemmatales bacterium]
MKFCLVCKLLLLTLLTFAQEPKDRHTIEFSTSDVLPTGAIARLGSTRFRHDGLITCQAVTSDG